MTKLKFKPDKEWRQLHTNITAIALHIPSCQDLDLNKVGNDLFLDKVIMPSEQLENWLSEATKKQAKEFVDLYMRFWNQTPRKALSGDTPEQQAAKQRSTNKGKVATGNQWTKISDLLMTIQGKFQAELYEILDNYPLKSWKPVINNVHRLFERYYYTVIEDFLPDETVAPADLVDGELIGRKVRLTKGEQILIRLFKSPSRHQDPYKQIRMMVGQESLERSPLMLDLAEGHDKSQYFPHDYSYNQCLKYVKKQAPDGTLPSVTRELWLYSLLAWRERNVVLKKAFEVPEWITLWQEIFEKAATEWQTSDEIFEILIKRIHNQAMPMDAAMQIMNAPGERYIEPLDRDEFLQHMALYDLQNTFHNLFLSPLVSYLPILEVRFVEPLDIAQEVSDFMEFGVDFTNEISKPPSYFRLRQPVAAKLWKGTFL
ncbi:hypothetical protein IPL85_02755 [Candidatus Saccharibacteria bacterium]|nr:MAG: hypothetical protein IPL85_02755 [Candidatus Saccharibacteria bacterium]